MSKIAFVFSGQGSQYVGMGKELYDNFNVAKEVFDNANNILSSDISNLCFNGPLEDLSKTINTQPAILTHSIACLLVLQEKNIIPEAILGFSLGEYSSLVASGAISFEDCLKLVSKRAVLMDEAVNKNESKMAAVIGLTMDELKSKIGDRAEICNYNTKTQIVIGGVGSEFLDVCSELEEFAKVVILNVSGAFHSSVLNEASLLFKKELDAATFLEPKTKILSNYTGTYYDVISSDILSKQINNTVLFYENITQLLDDGFDTFIELGPGKVTASFVKTIARDKGLKPVVLNVEDIKTLNKTLEKLEVK